MKFKALLFACSILGITIAHAADTKPDLKTGFIEYVKQNPGKIAQITAGGISLAGGAAFDVFILACTKSTDSYWVSAIGLAVSSSVAYSGYHTLNDALNNKLNATLKSLVCKAKAEQKEHK